MGSFIFIYLEEDGWAYFDHHANPKIAEEMAKNLKKNYSAVLETKVISESEIIENLF